MRYTGRRPPNPAKVAAVPAFAALVGPLAPSGKSIDWTRDMPPDDWGMCLNDTLGDCGIAGVIHAIDTWGSLQPPYTPIQDPQALALYERLGGYVPNVPATDRGVELLDVLNYWRANPIGGEAILGFCRIDPTNVDHVRLGIEIFGGLYTGVLLTEGQIDGDGPPWDVVSPVGEFGHCVWVTTTDDVTGTKCVTWGEPGQGMTWDFWRSGAVEECYAVLAARWVNGGRTPEGITAAFASNAITSLGVS